ncbi:MAG: trehalase family glycosidase [Acidobacteriota bacterium]|nr:trehalase family glycosidase [Acidobacteriota bacterium]
MKKIPALCAVAAAILLIVRIGAPGEVFYPWQSVRIGALDPEAWAGLAFVTDNDSGFAFGIKLEKSGRSVEKRDLFYLVSEVGPHSPDGQYSRIRLDTGLPFDMGRDTPILIKPSSAETALILEWSRRDENTIVGRLRCPAGITVSLEHYFPWHFSGEYGILPDGRVRGRSAGPTEPRIYQLWTDSLGRAAVDKDKSTLSLSFPIEKRQDIYFVAGVGDSDDAVSNRSYRYKNRRTIDTLLAEEEGAYARKRVTVEGLHQGVAAAATHTVFWSVLYQTERGGGLHAPCGRDGFWDRERLMSETDGLANHDGFLNALTLSVESSRHALDTVRSLLDTQYPNGMIPSRQDAGSGTPDRSQPPLGSFVVLKLFQKLGDREFLEYAYPRLEKWHAFWKSPRPGALGPRRDGNRDGLLEWGADLENVPRTAPDIEKQLSGKRRAMLESGQDNLANWDEASFNESTGTLTMNSLDLNCLYALDAWCLAQIASQLDKPRDYERYLAEYEALRELINTHMWNEKEGFYFDRHWDGRFSAAQAASNFYPLLARIPDERRALRLLRHLLDPKKFWGDYALPTLSRDNPAFKPDDQQPWRGAIQPMTNYLVYQGLKAYGFDAVASEFAAKSSALLLRAWDSFQIAPEYFDSLTGEAGGRRHRSGAALLALMAIEEYLDFTPWEGFRFGILEPQKTGRLTRIAVQGRHYQVDVSRSRTLLREEGREILNANGPAVFRRFLYDEREVSFSVKSLSDIRIRLSLPGRGKYQILVDGSELEIFRGRSVRFRVPRGDHAVDILLLEKDE